MPYSKIETAVTAVDTANDHALFISELFERHRKMLYGYLVGLLERRSDAEDVLQETYVRLLNADNLDRDVNRARSYAFRIATNLAYDTFRQRKRVAVEDSSAAERIAEPGNSPESIVNLEQSLEIIGDTLLVLKPRCRKVFLLRVAEGLSYETIAEKLEISKRTVEREMKRALDACQRRLERSER